MNSLLDPKNDYVFKRLFAETPERLTALINDLRPDLPAITVVEILNPQIQPDELLGKYIVLDVLARDIEGDYYNIEIQVRRYGSWNRRGLYYLARIMGEQLDASQDYAQLKAVIGLHLLDFDLFTATEAQKRQALWRFELRDATQPQVSLGNILQLNLLELKKADRLGVAPSPLRDWVTFFRHWQEEATMADIRHEPVQEALEHVRILSANDRERRLAFVRERALRDEVSFLKEARQEGRQEGLQEGRQEGLQEGQQKGQHQGIEGTLRKLITLKFGELPAWADERLTQASDAQLDVWVARILTADSLEALLGD